MAFIDEERRASGVCIIAIDQPTIVPNRKGMRPVEKVAASLASYIGGGVQTSNQSKIGRFDVDAPIWQFKKLLDAIKDPELSRKAHDGHSIIEVFPALASPSLNSNFHGRLRAPKYNPVVLPH